MAALPGLPAAKLQTSFTTMIRLKYLFIASLILLFNSGYAQLPIPAENPDDWLLAFVDVETTGLQPGYHEMIDIGIIYTDLDGNEKDRLFLRILPDHPERTSEGARSANAFSVERWNSLGALSKSAVVDTLIRFHHSVAGKKNVLLVAFNSHFDTTFLNHLFDDVGKSWRELYYYYVLDIPSMAWSKGIRLLHGQKLSDYFGIQDEPRVAEEHTGITGADLNLRLYREIISE